jgi:hypothetical protein
VGTDFLFKVKVAVVEEVNKVFDCSHRRILASRCHVRYSKKRGGTQRFVGLALLLGADERLDFNHFIHVLAIMSHLLRMITTDEVPPYPRLQVDNPLLLRLKPALLPPKLESRKHPTGPRLQEHYTRFLRPETFPERRISTPKKEPPDTGLKSESLLSKLRQCSLFTAEFGAEEECPGVRLKGNDLGGEGLEGGAGCLDVGANEKTSGLGLDFDKVGCALGYNCVSFGEGFADLVSSDAGLEGREEGFVVVEGVKFFVQRVSCEDTADVCLDLYINGRPVGEVP